MSTDLDALIARLRNSCRWMTFENNRPCYEREPRADRRCLECTAADALAAAEQRLRHAQAETWEQAAEMICNNREHGSVLYNQVEEMRRRAQAAREVE